THSSRCSSVSTILSATAGTLVQAALSKTLSGSTRSSIQNGGSDLLGSELGGSRKSSLRVKNGLSSSISTNSSMSNISSITATGSSENNDRMSLDRLSITNCDYLDAISAIKMSNPAASTATPSVVSQSSGSDTIVNENI